MNELIISKLMVLLEESTASKTQKDSFRAKAYRNAIRSIRAHPEELRSGKEASALDGVGDRIAAKIQEIIETGRLHQVDDRASERVERSKALVAFQLVWGVGPVKAKELWEAGARTIDDLRNDQSLLNDNQRVGLRYYEDLQRRVPAAEVRRIETIVVKEIRRIERVKGWNVRYRVCGSFRRHAETCGDMDILLCEENNEEILTELVNRLTESGALVETLGIGPTKYLGITMTSDNVAFRVDMEFITPEEWPFALLYFTGSGPFNERQRAIAKGLGYRLSEHGLKDVKADKYIDGMTTEREIFTKLGMEYLPPWERV
jgi:DNA polymerase/3'-5' exonuclease PolX